jgi:hypothetical protein
MRVPLFKRTFLREKLFLSASFTILKSKISWELVFSAYPKVPELSYSEVSEMTPPQGDPSLSLRKILFLPLSTFSLAYPLQKHEPHKHFLLL